MSYINTTTNEYPCTLAQMQAAYPLTIFPVPFEEDFEEFAYVRPVAQPEYDPVTQRVVEVDPVELDGEWQQAWGVVALTAEEIQSNEDLKAQELQIAAEQSARELQHKFEALWVAADRYVTGYISGVAVGILTIGVIQGKPKSLAVTAWSSSVWGEYYVRKALVTPDSVDNHDFSSFGPIPHSVPELQVEVGL